MNGRWFKGNLHTHTTLSDGDAPPDSVAGWYAQHGYDFLSLTDHNTLTPPALARVGDLVLVPGEEITMALDVHVNGLGLTETVVPPSLDPGLAGDAAKLELLRAALRAVTAQGLASVNHPNFRWALNFEVLRNLPELRFMEIFNGHPQVHNDGEARQHDGVERVWDRLLAAGHRIWGLATDDAHHYHDYSPMYANPGRGWVWVRARACTPEYLLEALSAGDFYASNGVRLADYRVDGGVMDIVTDGSLDPAPLIELVGSDGRVLEAHTGHEARLSVRATAPYVRARVTAADGTKAWLQPVFQWSI